MRRVARCIIEERPDVGVQDVAHLGAGDPDRERIECVVRPAPGPEAIREPEEVLLVDPLYILYMCFVDVVFKHSMSKYPV